MADKGISSPARRKQPNSSHCSACGLENAFGLQIHFYDNGVDEVFANYVVPEQYQGYPGVVHGGITATILDELVGRAVMTDDLNQFRVSAKLTVRYRKPIPIGKPLTMMGKVLRRRGRISVSRAEIRLPDGTIGAEAEATLVHLNEFDFQSDDFERLGWRVYPEELDENGMGGEDEST